MILKTAEFTKVLKYIKNCLPSSSLVPILNHICFKDDKIFTFNGVESIIIDYETGLNCAIPGKVLCDFIETINKDELEITQTDTNVKIKVGKAVAKLEMLPVDRFIYKLPEIVPIKQLTINSDFINGFKKCLISITFDNTKINQYGITLQNNCLYSTDNKRVSKYKLQENLELGEGFKILFPRGFCEIFTKIMTDSACIMSFSNNYTSVQFQIKLGEETTEAETIIKLRKVELHTEMFADVDFLDYEQFTNIMIDPKDFYLSNDFKESVNNCNLFLSGLTEKFIEFDISDIIEISAIGKFGNYNDKLDTVVTKNVGKFKVEIDLLRQLLNSTTFISFIKTENKFIVAGKEGDYLHLLGSLYIRE